MRTLLFSIALAATLFQTATARAEQLSLQKCIEMAKSGNQTLKAAAWESRIATENVRLARSTLYPRIDAQGGYTAQQSAQASYFAGRTIETQEPNYAFAGVSANYTLYDFGRRAGRRTAATAAAESSAHSYQALNKDITLQVIESYFAILETEKLITAATDEVTQVQQHRRVAQALFEEGVVTRNDILQADVRLATARQNLLAMKNRRENIWLRLNDLTGNSETFRAELESDSNLLNNDAIKADSENALKSRSEILALQKRLEAREAELDESRGNYFPEIFTKVGLDYVQNDKVREQTIMAATVGIRFNIFDGLATTATREKAIRQRSQAEDNLIRTKSQVRLEIATATNDLQLAGEQISVVESAIRQSEENLRINRERYQERVGTATEVLDAQTLLTQTRTNYYRALFNRQVAAARLKHATGEL